MDESELVKFLSQKIPAKNFHKILKVLINEAKDTDPCLAYKIKIILSWIENYKIGLLNAKRFVSHFLREFINDSVIHIALNDSSNHQLKIELLNKMTRAEEYWHNEVFPEWLKKEDNNLPKWKNKIMNGKCATDRDYIDKFTSALNKKSNTTYLTRYIADFSMATDMIISYHQHKACSLQLTTSQLKYCDEKIKKWQDNLKYWNITRGIFISFDSTEEIERIVNQVLWKSKDLEEEYCQLELK